MMVDASSSDKIETACLTFSGSWEELKSALSKVIKACELHSYGKDDCFAIRLALEEALSNAFKHGNGGDPKQSIIIQYKLDDNCVRIEVEDQGNGFDIGSIPDPTRKENIEIPAGRGIMLMRAYMSEVVYNDEGNHVSLVYTRQE